MWLTWRRRFRPPRRSRGAGRHCADLLGEAPGRAHRAVRSAQPLVAKSPRTLVPRRTGTKRRVLPVLPHRLVSRGAHVAEVTTHTTATRIVRGLDPALSARVDLGIFLEQLQALGELPLRREPASVPSDPRLGPLMRKRIDAVSLTLRRMVLPQLHVRVWPMRELRQLAQRGPVNKRRQHGAGGEVRGDATMSSAATPLAATAFGTAVLSTST